MTTTVAGLSADHSPSLTWSTLVHAPSFSLALPGSGHRTTG